MHLYYYPGHTLSGGPFDRTRNLVLNYANAT